MKNAVRASLVLILVLVVATMMLWADNQALKQTNEQLVTEIWDLKSWITNNQ